MPKINDFVFSVYSELVRDVSSVEVVHFHDIVGKGRIDPNPLSELTSGGVIKPPLGDKWVAGHMVPLIVIYDATGAFDHGILVILPGDMTALVVGEKTFVPAPIHMLTEVTIQTILGTKGETVRPNLGIILSRLFESMVPSNVQK